MRIAAKTLSSKPIEFIPSSHISDTSLSLDNPSISERPMVFVHGILSREDLLNIRSMAETNLRGLSSEDEQEVITNMGDVAEYIFKKKVYEVRNVLIETDGKIEEFESIKGIEKDRLWNTKGIDLEILECVKHIQDLSYLSKEEAKN